jgi:hypothetical protein
MHFDKMNTFAKVCCPNISHSLPKLHVQNFIPKLHNLHFCDPLGHINQLSHPYIWFSQALMRLMLKFLQTP